MARQIIVLERINPNAGPSEPLQYRYALWLSVPSARQTFYANPNATSQVKGSVGVAATASEIAAIQAGQILEVIDTIEVTAGSTLAQVQALLQQQFTAKQTALNASTADNWDHYGSSFDGATWTINTVA